MREVLAQIGLAKFPALHRDALFGLALAAGLVFWVALRLAQDRHAAPSPALGVVLSLLLWQPVVEELLFRGVVQGELLRRRWAQPKWLGISIANALTSLAFTALHFVNHSALWAASVIVPSLAFGFFRERHMSLYPPMALHIYYNTGYFLTAGFPT